MHRPGAFAEFVAAPAASLFKWPENVSAEEACLAEPLANGIHVARLIAHMNPGLILIIGAGSIGLMCLQAVRDKFPDAKFVVTDVDPERLAVALSLGADSVVRAGEGDVFEALHSLGGRSGADVVIDAAGSATTKQLSIDACRPGGCAVWIGLAGDEISLRSYDLTLTEKSVLGSYGATADDIQEALRLMELRRVDVSSWVTTFKPPDWVEGFRRQLDPATRDVKAVLTPT
jgi:L-iditol 2-dehydrogenase